MRSILFILFMLIVSTQIYGQDFYFQSNLSGRHRLTGADFQQESILMKEGDVYNIVYLDLQEVEFVSNESTIVFDLRNLEVDEGDTLSLDFIQYQRKDTVFSSSGCADGSSSRKKTSYIKQNKGCVKAKNLPDSIAFYLNGLQLYARKTMDTNVIMESGCGRKNGKQWGYDKTTYALRVTYVY